MINQIGRWYEMEMLKFEEGKELPAWVAGGTFPGTAKLSVVMTAVGTRQGCDWDPEAPREQGGLTRRIENDSKKNKLSMA